MLCSTTLLDYRELLKNMHVSLGYWGITDICKDYWITWDISQARALGWPHIGKNLCLVLFHQASLIRKNTGLSTKPKKITDTKSKTKLLA